MVTSSYIVDKQVKEARILDNDGVYKNYPPIFYQRQIYLQPGINYCTGDQALEVCENRTLENMI
ncbi:MAG: hypothetical protein KGI27_01515 [Thaumarchaeota archaeon]|nr:hypothetical protein [Nitrososphaerota archaeon]